MSPARVAGPLVLFASVLSACAGSPPQILTIPEKVVKVNETLEFDVAVLDEDTDRVEMSMRGAPKGAQLNQIEGKLAKFSWAPNPAQTGVHTLTFVADDGSTEDTETVNVKVEGGGAPELVSPNRYVVDLNTTSVVKFVLDVQSDAAELDFELVPDPVDEWGASVRSSGKRLFFTWEPTEEQKAAAQHSFLLRVTDDEDRVLQETVTIIFRGVRSDACAPGKTEPVIQPDHIGPQSGVDEIPVSASVNDRETQIQFAVAFWSLAEEPGDGDWEHRTLEADGGGVFSGVIDAPELNPGESATVTWHVCAQDDDDPDGDQCDHWACSENRTFTVSAALGLCDPCQPGQCGSAICLANGRSETFCGADCGSGDSCPSGFYCENISLSGGGSRKQCIPSGCANGASDPGCSCTTGRVSPPAAGDLAINEVLYDPPDACPETNPQCASSEKLTVDVNGDGVRARDEGPEEFVEIVNRSGKQLDVTGVTLADADRVRFTFPSLVLPPGRAALVFGAGDPTKFGNLGGAFKYSANPTGTSGSLQLNNSGDTLTLALGSTQLDQVQWGSSGGRGVSIVREREGALDATLVSHSTAPGASGARWSPGTHTCGTPFPLDVGACLPPSCEVTNEDTEPESDARATAPCLRSLPQTVTSTIGVDAEGAGDARDVFVVEGIEGQWLVARTEAGPAPDVSDTVLRLYSRAGAVLAENDDAAPGNYYSRVRTQFPSDGIYYLEVSPFLLDGVAVEGSYRLVVETSFTEPPP